MKKLERLEEPHRTRRELMEIWADLKPWGKNTPPTRGHLDEVKNRIHKSLRALVGFDSTLLHGLLSSPREKEEDNALKELKARPGDAAVKEAPERVDKQIMKENAYRKEREMAGKFLKQKYHCILPGQQEVGEHELGDILLIHFNAMKKDNVNTLLDFGLWEMKNK